MTSRVLTASRGPVVRRAPAGAAAGGSSLRALVEPGVLVVAACGAAAAVYRPVPVLAGCLLAGLVVLVWWRPVVAAGLLIGVTPLVAGIDRGVAIPLLRPNEALAVVLGATLGVRWLVRLRSGQVRGARPDAVELAILLLAVTSSVLPLMTMAVRGRGISTDDLLYSVVLWKLLAVYLIVRSAVREEREVRTCLLVSVGAACAVAVVGILQGLDLLGVRSFLAQHYAQFGDAAAIIEVPRGGSTLSLPAATADLMIMNIAVLTALWLRGRRYTALCGVLVGLFVLATLAAGEFSSAIGLVLGMSALALVTGSVAVLWFLGALMVTGVIAVWPVVAERLQGFSHASGMPTSWVGRLHNLETYFWPQLSSPGNVLLGVRPSARVPTAAQATGWVWIESGYTWLLWGGGLPLLGSFLFLTWAVARRCWTLARLRQDAVGAAATAAFVGVVVIAGLMAFDPHLTYRGSADEFFALLALTAASRTAETPQAGLSPQAGEVRSRW